MDEWEPIPNPHCDHLWAPAGTPYVTWTSAGTDSEPPEDAPKFRKEMCLLCAGIEVRPV